MTGRKVDWSSEVKAGVPAGGKPLCAEVSIVQELYLQRMTAIVGLDYGSREQAAFYLLILSHSNKNVVCGAGMRKPAIFVGDLLHIEIVVPALAHDLQNRNADPVWYVSELAEGILLSDTPTTIRANFAKSMDQLMTLHLPWTNILRVKRHMPTLQSRDLDITPKPSLVALVAGSLDTSMDGEITWRSCQARPSHGLVAIAVDTRIRRRNW